MTPREPVTAAGIIWGRASTYRRQQTAPTHFHSDLPVSSNTFCSCPPFPEYACATHTTTPPVLGSIAHPALLRARLLPAKRMRLALQRLPARQSAAHLHRPACGRRTGTPIRM